MKRLRKWWKELAGIDLIALGAGIFLTLGFIFYKTTFPEEASPYLDLWPNIATEILGVWFSVRLIDALIQKRERHHAARREIIGNLNYIRSEAQKLPPKIYDFNVKTLRDELMFSKERFPNRRKYLDSGEQSAIEQVINKLENVTTTANDYLEKQRSLIEARLRIGNMFDMLNNEREKVQKILERIDIHDSTPENIRNNLSNISLIETLLSTNDILLPEEADQMQSFLQISRDRETNNDYQRNTLTKPYLGHINQYKYTTWKTIEESINLLGDVIDFDYQKFYKLFSSTEQNLKQEPIPNYIIPTLERFLEIANQVVRKHEEIRDAIKNLIACIDSARVNLMEESELD